MSSKPPTPRPTATSSPKRPSRKRATSTAGKRGTQPARKPRLTFTKKLILTGVLTLVALMFVPSISTGIRQAQQINALERDNNATEQEIQDLKHKQDQLKDPTYIERLAREDFHYVKPGEDAYIVVSDGETQEPSSQANKGQRQRPWYIELSDSLKAVGLATEE